MCHSRINPNFNQTKKNTKEETGTDKLTDPSIAVQGWLHIKI